MPSIEILVPTADHSKQDPKLAAVLIDCLCASESIEQNIEISGGMVLSGNSRVRDVLTMVLRSKRFDELLEDLRRVFFASESGLGILRCTRNGVEIAFEIFEVRPQPKMLWKVRRVG